MWKILSHVGITIRSFLWAIRYFLILVPIINFLVIIHRFLIFSGLSKRLKDLFIFLFTNFIAYVDSYLCQSIINDSTAVLIATCTYLLLSLLDLQLHSFFYLCERCHLWRLRGHKCSQKWRLVDMLISLYTTFPWSKWLLVSKIWRLLDKWLTT